jgi:uroporphyrinogen-III synthase
MAINLQDRHVLVTRPDPQGNELCKLIRVCNGAATHLPTIEFAPPDIEYKLQDTLEQLCEQDWWVFISPQAVYSAWPLLSAQEFPPGIRYAAVGPGTIRALQEVGINASVCPTNEWNSEGLLDLPEFQRIDGKRIAIIRGQGGREIIDTILKKRGAEVWTLLVYKRILPQIDMQTYVRMAANKTFTTIVSASITGTENLKTLFGETGWSSIKKVPLVVVSERIKEAAQQLGYENVSVTQNSSNRAILDAIAGFEYA